MWFFTHSLYSLNNWVMKATRMKKWNRHDRKRKGEKMRACMCASVCVCVCVCVRDGYTYTLILTRTNTYAGICVHAHTSQCVWTGGLRVRVCDSHSFRFDGSFHITRIRASRTGYCLRGLHSHCRDRHMLRFLWVSHLPVTHYRCTMITTTVVVVVIFVIIVMCSKFTQSPW